MRSLRHRLRLERFRLRRLRLERLRLRKIRRREHHRPKACRRQNLFIPRRTAETLSSHWPRKSRKALLRSRSPRFGLNRPIEPFRPTSPLLIGRDRFRPLIRFRRSRRIREARAIRPAGRIQHRGELRRFPGFRRGENELRRLIAAKTREGRFAAKTRLRRIASKKRHREGS